MAKFLVCEDIVTCQSLIDEINILMSAKLEETIIWDYPRFIINNDGSYKETFYAPWLWENYPYKFCTICPNDEDIISQLTTSYILVEKEV